jgi:putative heme-binding domain-containing protein
VVTAGGKSYAGLVSQQASGDVTVLQTNGQKVELSRGEIDDIQPSDVSAMPTGLLNPLTLEEVADLFAFLGAQGANDVASRAASPK